MIIFVLQFLKLTSDGAIIQHKYPNRVYFDCKTKLWLTVASRHGKYIFTQESFNVQGTINDINEQDTSFLDCKHKHMMKSGAPPDKVRVLYCLLTIDSMVSKAELISKGYHSLVPGLIFRDGMGPF